MKVSRVWKPRPMMNAPVIYLAGANTHHLLQLTIHQPVLETFADMQKIADEYRPLWSGRLLDSGAYSAHTRGIDIDIGAYREFIEEKSRLYDGIANLDVISDWRASQKNWGKLKDLGAFPVFHEGEPWELLEELSTEQAKKTATPQGGWLGIGCQRPMVRGRIIEFLERCRKHIVGRVKLHGFGLTGYTSVLKFSSVDSTSWILGIQDLMQMSALRHLTREELISIQRARMERAPLRDEWDLGWRETKKRSIAGQIPLNLGD